MNESAHATSPAAQANADPIDPVDLLVVRFRSAIARAFPQAPDADPLITPCKDPKLGDFQANAAMGLAKRVGQKPRDVAAAIVKHLDLGDLAEPITEASIAGPGFINIRLRPAALAGLLASMDTAALGVPPAAKPERIVVDLMGVNLAKQMHVGHLRSPIIGDAIARVFERLGHTVLRQNHVGDWGLNIAMTTARIMRLVDQGKLKLDEVTLDDLDRAYKVAQAECQRDTTGLAAVQRFGLGPKAQAELEEQVLGATEAFAAARQTLIKLQSKEPATHAVWQKIYEVTMAECLSACSRLKVNVTSEHNAGESSYAEELAPMVDDLVARGIAEPDQGALIIRLDTPPQDASGQALFEPIKEPCLVRKTDGGFLYATTDIAAVRRRVQKLRANRIIYSIDARQNLHMRQVFAASIRAGYAIHPETHAPARMEHAAFGSVMGEDGRPFKTRSGDLVHLAQLIDETMQRALAAVTSDERAGGLSGEEARKVAEAVGVAALKYADLANNRTLDYAFSFDRMLAFEGNTGPYLLYALVRIRSIFAKGAAQGIGDSWKQAPFAVAEPAEKALAMTLLRYTAVVYSVAESLEPHRLCQYLYDLAGAFSTFYASCPVLIASTPQQRDQRLRLCDLAAKVLADGLTTIGIPTISRM